MKKKQPDFQKIKLRVGKTPKLLPKGKNITNTAFKSKKIITRDQKFITSADDVNLSDLLAQAVHPNVQIKSNALKKIGKYVEKNCDTLKSYFCDMLSTIGRDLLDSNGSVRTGAIALVEKSLQFLTTAEIDCFLETLTSQLSCMMTHMDISVKKDSLDFLGVLLRSAPSSVCYSKKVLPNLLDMISSRKPQKKKASSPKKRKLEDNISSSMTAVEWRDRVMTLILQLLQSLIDSRKKRKPIFQDEQRVYLDRKQLVNVPLYAGGGLAPAKVEFPSMFIKSEVQIAKQIRCFLGDLVKVSSDIITEEMTAHKKILPSESIEHLNTITQILCCLGQWYKLQESELDDDIIRMMNGIINKKLMTSFPYSMHESVSKKSGKKPGEMTCLHLNLGISYLFSAFILRTEFSRPASKKRIIICLLDAMGYGFTLDDKSVLLLLDSLKLFIKDISLCKGEEKNKYMEEISEIFDALKDFLINSKDEELKKEVQRLFIEIVLNCNYRMFLEYKGIKNWISFTFSQIKHMIAEKKADEDTIKCINQMCIRGYPAFMAILNGSDSLELLEYMKFENEDFQFMIMNLITHMTPLPPDFFEDVSDLILCDHSLSVRTIGKFIHLLCVRFSDERVHEKEARQFIKFLLNISLDFASFEKTATEFQDMVSENSQQDTGEGMHQQNNLIHDSSLKSLLLDVQDRCEHCILPSEQWKRNSDIFEVCLECLLCFKDRENVVNCTNAFLSELLNAKVQNLIPKVLPVHSAIALMEICTKVYLYNECEFRSDYAEIILGDLSIASLFYISVLTHKVPDCVKLKEFGVQRLQKTLYMSKKKAVYFTDLLCSKLYEQGMDEIICLYALRIMKFFIAEQYVSNNLIRSFHPILNMADQICQENSLQRAYLMDIICYCQSL